MQRITIWRRSLVKRLLIAAVFALAVLVPSASATTFTMRAGGYVQDRNLSMDRAFFSVNFKKGPGHKVLYTDSHAGIYFRSLQLTSVTLVRNAVKLKGVGLVRGQRVPFTAIATDHALKSGDWFTISWNHNMAHGGKVVAGNIVITPASTS
jgi:hypothetical protein